MITFNQDARLHKRRNGMRETRGKEREDRAERIHVPLTTYIDMQAGHTGILQPYSDRLMWSVSAKGRPEPMMQ